MNSSAASTTSLQGSQTCLLLLHILIDITELGFVLQNCTYAQYTLIRKHVSTVWIIPVAGYM